jgi:hypothetical protein
MIDPMISTLEQLGVSSDDARSIMRDVRHGDARRLAGELLLRGLWSTVIDETQPLDPARSGGAALQRLLDNGADPADLVDLMRETQVETIYNVAQLIDDPAEALGIDVPVGIELCVRAADTDAQARPLYSLHSGLMELDPAGRHGEPRSLAMRQLQELEDAIASDIMALVDERKFSAAAVLWKKHVGGDLRGALETVQALARGRVE